MKAEEHDLLLRALDADLTADEQATLNRLLTDAVEARQAWAAHQAVRSAVAAEAAPSFGPYFADRVMRRVAQPAAAPSFGARLVALLPRLRLVGAGLAAAVVMVGIAALLWFHPQTYTVPYGDFLKLTLPDGSTVELSSGSTLTYRRGFASEERRVRLDGEAFFSVVRQEARFVVQTYNALVEVRGTRFNVRSWSATPGAGTQVALEEGSVAVATREGADAPVVLAPGERTTVGAHVAPPERLAEGALETLLSWRTGGLVFQDAPLSEVLASLERRFAVRLDLASPALADLRVTYLDPHPPTLETVLSTICVVRDLRYRRTANGFEILGP